MSLVIENETTSHIILLPLLVALMLGIFHALSPGHGKTVISAYLVGIQGQPFHAVVLGLLVSLTHIGTVFLLGLLAMIAAQNMVLLDIFPFLEILSGSLLLMLGLILVITRWKGTIKFFHQKRNKASLTKIKPQKDGKYAIQLNQPIVEDGPSHTHDPQKFGFIPIRSQPSSEGNNMIQWRSLIRLGISSGLVPCPNAIAILLIAVAVNRILFGLSMIAAFSLGLAITLILIGLLIMQGKKLFQRLQWFNRAGQLVPMLSAFALVGIGLFLTLDSISYLQNRPSNQAYSVAGMPERAFTIDTASILFLDKDNQGLNQLFQLSISQMKPYQITQNQFGIRNFNVSPTRPEVIYTTINQLDSSIWLLNLITKEESLLLNCINALCSNPDWMVDGLGILYQKLDYTKLDTASYNQAIYPSIWWLAIESKNTASLFQDSQLPGINPRFSPDGEYISYFSGSSLNINIYHLSTGNRQTIPSISGMPPAWSPQSSRVIMADVTEGNGAYQSLLSEYDLTTETQTWIDENPTANDHSPVWSPDGEWIASIRMLRDDTTQATQSQVWLMNPVKKEQQPASEHRATHHGELVWSPDSQYLLYSTQIRVDNSFTYQIHLLDNNRGQFEVLYTSGTRPKWAP